ncbi:MAG: hypothetical protein ACHP7N_15120 [Caulobacterales bacterium]
MKARPGEFSMTGARKAARPALCALALAGLAGAALAQPTALAPEVIAGAERPAPYPTFASVPSLPSDVRSPGAWKEAVVEARLAGRSIVRLTADATWTLADTDAFAGQARAEAAPPPPITTPSDADTEALVKALRARATPPPRRR